MTNAISRLISIILHAFAAERAQICSSLAAATSGGGLCRGEQYPAHTYGAGAECVADDEDEDEDEHEVEDEVSHERKTHVASTLRPTDTKQRITSVAGNLSAALRGNRLISRPPAKQADPFGFVCLFASERLFRRIEQAIRMRSVRSCLFDFNWPPRRGCKQDRSQLDFDKNTRVGIRFPCLHSHLYRTHGQNERGERSHTYQ